MRKTEAAPPSLTRPRGHRVRRATAGRAMIVLDGTRRPVTALAFGHDGRELYAGGGTRPVEVWDAVAGQERSLARALDPTAIDPLALNPRTDWVYTCEGYGTIWAQAPDGQKHLLQDVVPIGGGRATAVAVRPDGGQVVVGFNDACVLAAFAQPEFEKPRHLWTRMTDASYPSSVLRVRGLAYFPDGERFAVLQVPGIADGLSSFTVRDGVNGAVQRTVTVRASQPDQLKVSPDGSAVVVKCGQVLNVWDAGRLGRPPVRVVNTNRKHFTCVAYHPGGKYLAATSRDETVKLFDTQTWAVARTFTWKVGKLRSVCFSPDGTRAAVGSDAGKVVIWDVDV